MAFMITKLYSTHVVVYVQILLKIPVVFAEILPYKTGKNRARFLYGVRFRFGFGAYVKALKGFKAFYFSFRFRCICEMALKILVFKKQHKTERSSQEQVPSIASTYFKRTKRGVWFIFK